MGEKGVASETEKLEEAEKVGIASAGKVLADNPPSGECDGVNGTDGLEDKMESLGARIAKEEFSRLVAEEEEKKKQSEAEHRFKSLVEEAARFAARAVFSMMTSEEKEASGGENVEVYDAERDQIFEEEIKVAGEEAALAEFDEFLRIEEMNNGNEVDKTNVDEEAERLEVAALGKEAALKEYKLLREELENRIRETRLREEEERLKAEEEERKRAEEEAERQRMEEEEKLRQEEEERLRREEEERIRREEEERLQREEEERLRREEEERLRREEEERQKAEEERLLREEEERQRREEEERLRREEEERLRKEEEERLRAEE